MKKLLVLTSTFPRWVGDTNPPFVYELSKRLTDKFNVSILTPHCPNSKKFEVIDKLNIYRFKYFFEKWEVLAGNGGILPALKQNKLLHFVIPFFLLSEIIATIRLVKKIKPDIIHAHWIIPQGLAAYVNFLINKTPYVVTSHGSDLHSLGFNFIKKVILNNAKKITVVSNYLRDEIIKISPKLLNKTEVIPMGVDTDKFNPNKYNQLIKDKYNIKGKILLFVGRLAHEKGINFLIEAMPKVIEKFPKTKLLIIGGGPLEQELKKQVTKLNIKSNVVFLGPILHDDLPQYYATADIFVSPSLKEGFGLTFVEALMSGCTAIGTNVGGIKDILPKSNIVKQQNSKKMSILINNLIKKDTKSIFDVKKFKWEFVSKEYVNCLSN